MAANTRPEEVIIFCNFLGHKPSPDEDERLLKEVDAEIARGVTTSQLSTSASGTPVRSSLMLPLSASTPLRPVFLDVVQETADAEAVEDLQKKLDETSRNLKVKSSTYWNKKLFL